MKTKQFYEKYPYPNYEFIGLKEKNDLYKIKNYIFNIISEEQIKDKEILEVGCGTGVLTAKLSLYGAKTTGTDISNTSLNMAKQLFNKYELKGKFINDDIINTKITKKYDIVISLGTLHHTENPEKAFENLVKLTKPNGMIIFSLYNKYGYIADKIKYSLLKHLINKNSETHYLDAYKNPRRSNHSINEILKWIKNNNLRFINAFPPINIRSYFLLLSKFKFKLFKNFKLNPDINISEFKLISKKGNKLTHLIIELCMLFYLYNATIIYLVIKK